MPCTGIDVAAEANTSGKRSWDAVNKQSHIPNCEGIPRIPDRHADTVRTTRSYSRKRDDIAVDVYTVKSVPRIGRKRHSGQGRIVERPRIFEIPEYRQVFVAQVAGERAVINLTVSRRQR